MQYAEAEIANFTNNLAQDFSAIFSQFKPAEIVIDEFVESDHPEDRDVITDAKLDPCNLSDLKLHWRIGQSLGDLFKGTPLSSPNFVRHNLPLKSDTEPVPAEGSIFHQNLVTYLTVAWNAHFSVVLSPDMVFYTLLAELGEAIKADPSTFERLFTRSPGEKTQVTVMGSDPTKLNLCAIVETLKKLLPSDAELFTATFSTSSEASLLAMNCAFADAMSPYYGYNMTMCGIPRVRVLGSKADWQSIESKMQGWKNLVGSSAPKLVDWLQSASDAARDIYTKRDPEFWSGMFSIEKCRSGHTDSVGGWINRFYRKGYFGRKYKGKVSYVSDDFYNFDSHLSSVEWTVTETQKKFKLYSGLLYSTYETPDASADPDSLDAKYPFLIPHFAHIVQDSSPKEDMSETEYSIYISSLNSSDADFLRRHRKYLPKPTLLNQNKDAERIQRQHIVLTKFQKLREAVLLGDEKLTSLKLTYTTRSDLMSKADTRETLDTDEPLVREIATAVATLIKDCPTIQTVALQDCGLLLHGDILWSSIIGNPNIKKIRLTGGSPYLIQALLHPACQLEALAVFCWSSGITDSAALGSAIAKTSAPLTSINLRLPRFDAELLEPVLERAYHQTHPLEKLGLHFEYYLDKPQAWQEDEKILAILARAPSKLKLRSIKYPFLGWIYTAKGKLSHPKDFDTSPIPAKIQSIGAVYAALLLGATTLEHLDITRNLLDLKIDGVVAAILALPLKSVTGAEGDLLAQIFGRCELLESVDMKYGELAPDVVPSLLNALEKPSCRLRNVNLMASGKLSDDEEQKLKALFSQRDFAKSVEFVAIGRSTLRGNRDRPDPFM